jgi:hypothetical protein
MRSSLGPAPPADPSPESAPAPLPRGGAGLSKPAFAQGPDAITGGQAQRLSKVFN